MGLAVERDDSIHGLGLCAVSPDGVVRTLADQVLRTLLSSSIMRGSAPRTG